MEVELAVAAVVVHGPPSIAQVRYTVLAVGKVKPPYADDVAHYERLLAKQARVDVVEVADDDAARAPRPASAPTCRCSTTAARAYDSEAFARWLEERRQAGPRRLLRGRRRRTAPSSSAATTGSRSAR